MKVLLIKLLIKVFSIVFALLLPIDSWASDVHKTNAYWLNNVNVVDVSRHQIIPKQALKIQAGTIVQIIDCTSFSDEGDVPVVDGENGYVTPGLIDMHVHMYEQGAFALALSHGVTHVRVMNGIPAQLEWKKQINDGDIVGSTASISSPILSGYENASLHHTVLNADEAISAIRKYHQQGYDLIKAYGNLSGEALNALVAEGQRLNMPIAKHGPHGSDDVGLDQLKAIQSFEHVEDIYQGSLNHEIDNTKLQDVASELKQTGVPITPTLNIYHQLVRLSTEKESFLKQIPQEYTSTLIATEAKYNQVKRWLNASEEMGEHNIRVFDFLLHITQVLHDSGVELLVGSDSGVLLSPHGLATHHEMELFQQAGIDAFSTLQAATLNAAKALGLEDEVGQVTAGRNADFIFTHANPIQDLSVLKTPDAVVKNGKWYSQQKLQNMRQSAIDERSLWDEFLALAEAL
ncbi:amidohydrolase family protein [Alteromonas facilis]|uniref:amidohydrolase family protein n=1 Tax=Alteromonas facilis TaxID=2048004 RepID=UPI000C28B738|nr:amidohydrolase family protein [Alteromonas facilis]